jgi:hypothetical protein
MRFLPQKKTKKTLPNNCYLTGTKQKTNTMNKHYFYYKFVGFIGSGYLF